MSATHKTNAECHEQAFSTISRRSFFVVVVLLLSIILFSWILTYIVPQGQYARDENGMIIDGTFVQGPAKGIALWRVLTAPFRVFVSEDAVTIIMISVFLLIMSGVFNLLEKTDGLRVIIGRTVRRFSSRREVVIALIVLLFMAFGSFFGMFEELVTLLPLVIVFMLSMGYDTMTGLGVCMMAACFMGAASSDWGAATLYSAARRSTS